MQGKANLEVRPTSLNKGEIAKRLVEEYGHEIGQPPEFTLCLGDDFTDEDMFRALNASALPKEHVFTVTVGASSKMTLAIGICWSRRMSFLAWRCSLVRMLMWRISGSVGGG